MLGNTWKDNINKVKSTKYTKLMDKMEKLKLKFNQYKDNLQFPRLYLSNHFTEMKNEVDLVFNKNILENSNNLATKEQLQKNYTEIIQCIEAFETECLTRYSQKRVQQEIPDKPSETVESIGTELNKLHKEIEIEFYNTLEISYKFMDYFIEVFHKRIFKYDKLVEAEKFELNRKLFLQNTMVFMQRDQCLKKQNSCIGLGNLLVSNVDYFSKQDIMTVLLERNEVLNPMSLNEICGEVNALDRLILLAQLKTNLESVKSLEHIHRITFAEFVIKFNDFQELKISNNHLKVYPDLKKVTLERNCKRIPSNLFRGLNHLTAVYLADNQFIDLDKDTFKDQKYLVEIDIIYNNLETLHTEMFKNCVSLKILKLKGNQLKVLDGNIFNGLINLECIDLGMNQLKMIAKETFLGLLNLKTISLQSNSIEKLDRHIFNGLANLQVIDLSRNFLSELDQNIFNCCTLLSHIDLGYNRLNTLDKDIFKDLINLEQLTLRKNEIEILDENIFKDLKKIKKIILIENCFTQKIKFNSISDDVELSL